MIDASDRAEFQAAVLQRYNAGEIGMIVARAQLVMCGNNATECDHLLAEYAPGKVMLDHKSELDKFVSGLPDNIGRK